MTFKEAYPQKLEEHGDEMSISLGFDRGGRASALAEAVGQGCIAAEHAAQCLPEGREQFQEIAARRLDPGSLTLLPPMTGDDKEEEA